MKDTPIRLTNITETYLMLKLKIKYTLASSTIIHLFFYYLHSFYLIKMYFPQLLITNDNDSVLDNIIMLPIK